MRPLLCLTLPLVLAPAAPAAGPLSLKDGDRVVLLGNTLIEREQKYGWWELALTARFAGKKVTVRNLGWSGDTVFGHARAGFGSVADGFKELKTHTLALKPTHLLIAYGTNESFDGPAGLPAFVKGLNTLLDELAPTKATVTLLGPMRQGTMPAPLPDPAKANKNLRLYADAIRDVARKRELAFIDLYELFGDVGAEPGVTDNGIHLTGPGYRWSAPLLLKGLGLQLAAPKASADAGKGATEWQHTLKALPVGRQTVTVHNLPAGKHTLTIDGAQVATADAAAWARGVTFSKGPDFDQAEKLRQAIVAKNELYFHRWRPQNVTYLFGFRKHEQGKNASDIPKFDPLVEAKEKEIAKLAVPVARTYKLVPAK